MACPMSMVTRQIDSEFKYAKWAVYKMRPFYFLRGQEPQGGIAEQEYVPGLAAGCLEVLKLECVNFSHAIN